MGNLRNLIVFFVRNFPRPITRTELVKLVYLFEYQHVQICGHQYSGVVFVRDKFGPFAPAILDEAEALEKAGVISCCRHDIDTRCVLYEYEIRNPKAAQEYDLTGLERGLALSLIDRASSLSVNQIKAWVYSTPPMSELLKDEVSQGHHVYRRRINMEKGKTPKRFSREELIAAKRRLDATPDRGSDEEYYAALLETYKEFEDLRRRATACLLQN